ncbi:gfo/Idh/MocA family oxidoreductase [Actinobacteria bacterium YIM 96077]|uniref:Gfo/Idh/MocA family oxidoreductase n=1 Tax=Phytoactinopolyspora halophila TaxID=1981511 RepID=A0A329QCA4_9ACTN|nr:Gfo/Idh/MocA family oxidoreductase [Phytoactinopolyspora halophila]AYY14003.1 gfo/Idh/MocA family oxidoreductase [Actinobacteria bacterium YIM 96077]RAW10020.1 gfo/Idh/MocA family oxidoreductase [Phytoactinopolyspora halophila]
MIRLAVAGMAHQHVLYIFDELAHQPGVELVAVAEPDPALLARYEDRCGGVPAYGDHREMLSAHDPDIVAVAGVYTHRADVVADALRAGAHVIADKPLCTSLEQLERIEQAARETGGVVSVLFEKRGYPVTLAARRLLATGTLGELTLVASTGPHVLRHRERPPWFFSGAYGGVLGDLAVHDVDMVLAITGARDGYVVGSTGNRAHPQYPEFHDHGAMLLVAGPVTATIDAHWLAPEAAAGSGRYVMRLVGTGGTAEMRWTDGELEVATHERDTWLEPLPTGARPAEDVVTALAAGRPPEVGTAESLAATRLALLAQRSADRGGVVEPWKLTG